MIASIGMPCSSIVVTNALLTAVSAGESTCSTARSSSASCRAVISIAPWRRPPIALRDTQHPIARATSDVAVHTDRGDEADTLLEAAAHLGTQHARRDHPEVAVDLEPVECERVPARHDRARVGSRTEREERNDVVGHEHAQQGGVVGRVEFGGLESVGHRRIAGLVAPHADRRRAAAVAEIQRPRAALVAVTDDGDPLVGQNAGLDVAFVGDRGHRARLAR